MFVFAFVFLLSVTLCILAIRRRWEEDSSSLVVRALLFAVFAFIGQASVFLFLKEIFGR